MNNTTTKSPPLRVRGPTIDNRPGDGHQDEVADRLQDVREAVAQMSSDDEYSSALAPAVNTLTAALEAARRFAWNLSDTYNQQMQSAVPFIEQMVRDRAQNAPQQGGFWSQADLAAYRAGERRSVEREAQSNAVNRVLSAKQTAANSVAQRVLDAFEALRNAIDEADDDYSSPAGLRDDFDPAMTAKIASIREGLLSADRPCKVIADKLEGYMKRGQLAKAELLMVASETIINETKSMVPAMVVARRQNASGRHAADFIDDEKDLAFRLGRAFEQLHQQLKPASIGIAIDCMAKLRTVFDVLMGISPRGLSMAEFNAKYLSVDSDKNDAAMPWQLDPKWTGRFIGPTTDSRGNTISRPVLPGYSPIVFKTSLGSFVRAPKE